MKKRMISIALVLALLVQILPTYVFAEDDASDNPLVEAVEPGVQEPGLVVLGEMTDRRGENEKHFRMNDGSFIAVDYDVPVHYSIDGGESWEDIDNTLTPSRDDSEIYVAENGNNTRSFAQSLQSGFLFSVGADSHAVRMRLTNASTQNDSNEADSTIPAAPIYDETESSPADQTDGETESSPVDQFDGETESSPADQTDGETESSPANQTDDETESSPADQTDGETESSPADQTDGETESSLADQTDDGEEAATSTDTPIDNPVPSEAENPSLPLQVISTYNSSSVAEISYPDDKRMGSSSEAQNNRGEGGTLSLAEQVTPSKLRAEVLYRDVYEGVDLRYELYSWNVKETILVKEARENCVFSFDLELDELTPVLMDDGSIELRDEADEALYLIPAPYMTDADGAESDAVSYGLTQSESGVWTLTVVADEDWINDENRTFPVEIDPTVIDKVAWSAQGIGVTYVVSGAPYTTHTHYQSIWLGYTPYSDLYEHQIYVGWDDLPKVPSGSEVINAAFYLGQLDYQAVGPSSIIGGIHAVTSARPSGYSSNYNWICDLYWNNKPALDSTVMDYTTINSATAGHYISWDITPLVKAWYVDGNTQTRAAGIKLYNSSAYGSSYYATAKFHGYGASSGPLFVVTYRDLTGIEPYYTYQSLGADRAGSAYISDYTGALTTVTPLVSYASTVNPFQLSLIYNSSYFEENGAAYNVPQKMGYGFFMGSGTKLNLMQKVEYVDLQYEIDGNATKRYIKYTDGDGTAHYFATDANKQAQEPANSTTYYYDEDGLGLKVTEYTTDFFRMEDDRGNTMYFVRGYLTILIDANGNRYDIFFRHSDGTMESSGYPNYTGDRIDHINQKNAGETNGITVATFQYETVSGQTALRRVVDAAGNSYRLNYSGNQLQSVQRKLLDDSDYSSYVAFSYSGNGSRMTQLKDMISTYCINVSYADGRVASYSEAVTASNNSNVTGAGATVTRIPGDRTVYTDWGNDRIASTSDDIITTYLFDYAGRTVNAFTTDTSGAIRGASNAIHSGTGDTNKANNRTLRSAGIGMAAMPVVRNGGFEFTGSDTAWTSIIPTGSGNTAQAQNGGLIRTGNRSFKTQVVGAATTPTGCSKSLGSLTAGKTYTVSVYVNTSQATAINSEGVYLKVSDPWNCTWISEHLNYITETGIDDGWVRLVFPFTAVRNGNHTVYLYNKDMTGPVYFDDFQIDEGDGPSNVNLLDNGGIHSSAVGWYTQANNAASAATVTAIQGNKALSIVGDPQTDRFIWQTVTLNQPVDQTYVLSGWAKASAVPDNVNEDNTPREQDTNKQFGLRAILTYSDNTTEYHYVPFNPDVSDWQFVSMAIVPKKSGNNLRVSTIKVICAYEKNANTAYFDNLCLTKEVAQTMTYNDEGELVAVNSTGTAPESAAYSNGEMTQMQTSGSGTYNFSYDNQHNLTQASNGVVKENYTYDSKGNPTASSLKKAEGTANPSMTINNSRTYTGNGNLLGSVTNANGYTTSYSYGSTLNIMLGQASAVTDPKGTTVVTNVRSDGNIASSWIASHIALTRSYDSKMNLTALNRGGYNVSGNDPTPHNQHYSFSYDDFGNTTAIRVGTASTYNLGTYTYAQNDGLLTGMAFGNGDSVSYTYDNYGRKTQTTSSDGDSYRYRYTGDGQLWQMKDNAGNLLYKYTYDTLGRLIGSSMHSGSTLTLRTQHQYDNANRLARQVWALSGKTYQEGYAYDSHGRLTQKQLTLPGNTSANILLNYDALSRLSAVTSPVYDIYYNYLAAQNGTGTTSAVHQFSINPRTTNANRYKQLFFRYSYDELGNIASAETITQNSTLSDAVYYSYDNQSQLTSAASSANGIWYYQYDAYGNIRNTYHGTDYISYTYGNSNWLDLLTAVSGTKNGVSFSGSYSYDGAGNPTSFYNIGDGTSWTMTWRNGRELATAVNGTHSVSYDYDVNGLRTYKIVDGVRHDYIYASGQLLRESYTQSGTAYTLDFVYDHSGRPYMLNLTTTVSGASTTTPYYYLLNLQGDVVEIVNASEVPVADYSYDAYGNILSATGSLASVNPLRYRGYYYDTESGFYYLQSRYYAPALGRFINADSYASTGQGFLGYNMFAYCNNTAPNTADYNGNDAIWIQEANSARGFGHSGLMVQDENGDWYYFYWGPQDESYTFGMLIIGVDRRIVVEKVDAKDYNLRELGGVRRAISDSDNTFVKNRADKITAAFYFSGDYTETMNTLQGWVNENDHYQLLTDNCVQRSIIAMGKSNNLFDNLAFTIPNNAMYSVYIRSDNAVPNSWHFYSKTHSYRTVS